MRAVFEAQRALHLNNQELGQLLGSSKRTVERWSAGHATPYHPQLVKLAAAVHARDPGIAHRLATAMGQTLESLGVVAPPAPVVAPPATATEPTLTVLTPLLAESVVAAAAEALDVSPRVARPAVVAAMERAKTASLSVDDLLAALRPPPASKRAKS